MRIKKYFMLAALPGVVLLMVSTLLADNLTLTTYYPAPFGAYDRIKLVPREALDAKGNCDTDNAVGTIYYSKGGDKQSPGIYVCQKFKDDSFDWVFLARAFRGNSDGVGNQKVVCVKPDGHFGTCLNNPSFDGTCACN